MAYTFQDVAGVGGYGSAKTYARCKSIRKEVFSKNNDRFGQILGSMTGKLTYIIIFPLIIVQVNFSRFQMCLYFMNPDMYMNTLYIYILFCKYFVCYVYFLKTRIVLHTVTYICLYDNKSRQLSKYFK